MPKKPGIEDLFQIMLVRKYESYCLGNLNLMKDWESKGSCEGLKVCYYGHNHIGTISRNENITAKRNQGYK